ncbi:hypothetical protein PBAL39_10746 [Pedobacter sp. BAL39]|uniref:DUF5009 domain-containing protein n=1 Tax=Pedobacter sp. BAL39 TaxID=391596 RepID=UPI00015599E0|nr:DUF5009 domain-containing protein [Pedobacter sp. BAL39]EDM37617.1 hypothetical protein PBAL39_10746 [Pedobacter sp. BAL39]
MTANKNVQQRLVSIDALRALVMLLMIFVNDLWSLIDIPGWLEHAPGDANYMGLADVVFPAFLVIVGLSVPYAIDSRRRKGDGNRAIFLHIVYRTIALLVMGFFHVNMETYGDGAVLSKGLWQILVTISFFLIWLDYSSYKPAVSRSLKMIGVLLLLTLATLYKSADASGILAMRVQWWGILGLIGWGYFVSSCIFLFSKGNLLVQLLALVFFLSFSSANHLGWLEGLYELREYVWFSENGAMAALPIAGIVIALVYKKYGSSSPAFWLSTVAFAAVLLLFGWLTNPFWGISKIRATPSWTSICAGVTVLAFMLMVYLTETLGKRKWYDLIKPAGTSTLTCYLLPYLHYALIGLFSLPQLPVFWRTGAVGLGKSLLYALLIITLTGLLGKLRVRLKI